MIIHQIIDWIRFNIVCTDNSAWQPFVAKARTRVMMDKTGNASYVVVFMYLRLGQSYVNVLTIYKSLKLIYLT